MSRQTSYDLTSMKQTSGSKKGSFIETSSYEPTPFTTSVSPTQTSYSQSMRGSLAAVAKVNRDPEIAFSEKL